MNLDSQQLRSDLSLEIAKDQKLTPKQMKEKIINILGSENCSEEIINTKKVLVYTNADGIKTVLLLAAVTYLGGVHLTFKKRIQLKSWYKDIVLTLSSNPNYDVRFIGVYHYKNNIIFVDFVKDTYMLKKMHNSAAHVYINDLYQGMKFGCFKKIDQNGNTLYTIRCTKLKDYLDNNMSQHNNVSRLFNMFEKFNHGFPFEQWLEAIKCVEEMRQNSWSQWAQSEWAGWYLEYKFYHFTVDNNTESYCKYIRHKKKGDLDFDLWFDECQFYGDLKSDSMSSNGILGNDKTSVLESINCNDKFWYVVYEHDTIKDIDMNYEASEYINLLKYNNGKWHNKKAFNSHSYGKRMKHSVNYQKMYIIEINRINASQLLSDFNQGHQPDGSARNTKVKINKRNIDNFVIYRYGA